MKDKTAAALLAIFLGFLGVHRFYLKQPGLGILYFFLMFTGISFLLSFIDFIAFLTMDQQVFDLKYNRYVSENERRRDTDFTRRRHRRRDYERPARREEESYRSRREAKRSYTKPPAPAPASPKSNPFKKSGIAKFKDFDYEGAIEDFNKALTIDAQDVSVYFNLACTYSLMEKKDAAFEHLHKAVELGFVDFEKIKTHDALAFIRIQDEFDTFVKNGYRLNAAPPVAEQPVAPSIDLLEQLRQLGELREKGLLTDTEFNIQKRKLLGDE